MPKKILKDSFLRSKKYPEKRTEFYDTVANGLALRVTPQGHKSFVFRYRFGKNSKRFTIGEYPTISLSEARLKSKELYKDVINGIDPLEVKRNKKYKPKELSFGDLVKVFNKQHLPTLKESTRKEYKRIIDNELLGNYKWGNISVSDISAQHVREVLNTKAYEDESFTMANRIRSVISKIFEFGIKRVGLTIESNPVDSTAVFQQGENVRERVYNEDEIKELWEFWETQPEPMRSVYKMLLLTGQRKSEVMKMEWNDIEENKPCKRIKIDHEGRSVPEVFKVHVWTITDTKNNVIHEVPLSDAAFELIEDLKPITGKSDYVFESPRKKGEPLSSLRTIDQLIQKDSSVTDFRIHDLRRTFSTKTEETGIDFSVIKKVLNHKDGDVTSKHYTWYNYMDKKMEALNRWSWRLKSILEGKESTKIHKIG